MKWIVKIEEKDNQRIVVEFNPIKELLFFYGQYKPHNKEWMIFSEDSHNIYDVNVEIIQQKLLNTYEVMKKRLDKFDEINEGFTLIKIIEIQNENNDTII